MTNEKGRNLEPKLSDLKKPKTNLQYRRKLKKITQTELSELTGINYRTLCDYEQKNKDINNARCITVYRLSKILECGMTDLMELPEIEDGNEGE